MILAVILAGVEWNPDSGGCNSGLVGQTQLMIPTGVGRLYVRKYFWVLWYVLCMSFVVIFKQNEQ